MRNYKTKISISDRVKFDHAFFYGLYYGIEVVIININKEA